MRPKTYKTEGIWKGEADRREKAYHTCILLVSIQCRNAYN